MRVLLIGATLLVFVTSGAAACQCATFPPISEEASRSRAVFSARVTRIEDQFTLATKISFWFRSTYARLTAQYHEPELRPRDYGMVITLEPIAWFKSSGPQHLKLLTGRGGGDCGFMFKEGKTYLVYVNQPQPNWYDVDMCSRTKPLSEAREDVAFLRTRR